MDYSAIINLIKEMNQTDLSKIEIEQDGFKIRLEKEKDVVTVDSLPQTLYPAILPTTHVNYIPSQTVSAQDIAKASPVKETVQEDSHKKIVSPMVGTFYSSPSPEKPAFLKVGDKVTKGETVCIIEAMKLMNEIESEIDGEVIKILVNNEQMVEFGQPLFEIG